jgi:hypothetical protein
MARDFKLQGDTDQQKLNHAEVVIGRLLQVPPPSMVVAIPPMVVFHYCHVAEEDGLIGRWIFPLDGIIKMIHVFSGQMAEKLQPVMTMLVKSGKDLQSREELYRVGANTFSLGLPVKVGGILEIHTSDPLSVFELSISILIEVGLEKAAKEQLVLEELTNARETTEGKVE